MADITPLRPVGTRSLIEVEGIALPASGYIVQTKIAADALPMEFIQYAIGAQLRTIVDHEASARIGFDPDGIHQVRSAMRRLRTHIAQFDDVLDPKWAATSRSELRWFGRRLAGVRDLDVMRDVLSACAASLPPAEVQQLEPLFRSITTQRNAMHDSLRTAFDSRRYQRLIARLTSAVDDPPQRNDIAGTSSDLARVIAATAWDKLNSSVEQLGATPSDAALHHVRRRAKRQWL